MEWLEWVIWTLAFIHTLSWSYSVRYKYQTGTLSPMLANMGCDFMIIVMVLLFSGDVSKFHILWIYPVVWIINMIGIPFLGGIFLTPIYLMLCCIGVDKEKAIKNHESNQKYLYYLQEGWSHDEAVELLESESKNPS